MSQSIFFFNDTATTKIYTLALHDALPISPRRPRPRRRCGRRGGGVHGRPARLGGRGRGVLLRPVLRLRPHQRDRKSTRLNSSHANISYAVFCLKKKNKTTRPFFFSFLLHS